jgi:hypothetical protein
MSHSTTAHSKPIGSSNQAPRRSSEIIYGEVTFIPIGGKSEKSALSGHLGGPLKREAGLKLQTKSLKRFPLDVFEMVMLC